MLARGFDDRLRQALDSGYEIGQGREPRGRFVYLFDEGHPGTVIEMAELTPERRTIFAAIAAASVDWDGTANPADRPRLDAAGHRRGRPGPTYLTQVQRKYVQSAPKVYPF